MPRPLFDSEYIFGFHDPGGEQIMLDAGKPGWIVFTEAIGHDPNDSSGRDYTAYSSRNLGIICRINNGYSPDGTIPNSSQYNDFARRCANFVANTRGCKIWIIGNEMNYAIERPSLFARSMAPALMPQEEPSSSAPNKSETGVTRLLRGFLSTISGGMGSAQLGAPAAQTATPAAASFRSTNNALPPDDPTGHGLPERFSALTVATRGAGLGARAFENTEAITPEMYVRCYQLCRAAIRALPGHADDQVLVGAVAPWNNQTTYAGNPNGDWVQYFQDILTRLGAGGCDGMALHTYTHQADPNLITDASTMNAPFQNRHFQFRAYRDFMGAVPAAMRNLPVYITETDQDVPWLDQNIAWVQRAYGEINFWNKQPGNQQIRALALYRWPNFDRWGIESKNAVKEDFRIAMQNDYRWQAAASGSTGFVAGQVIEAKEGVNIRRTPGYAGKPANDVVYGAAAGSRLVILGNTPQTVDNLVWWNVQTQDAQRVTGWAAQTNPAGAILLKAVDAPTQPGEAGGAFALNDRVRTLDIVRMRRTPGFANKPASDVLADVPAGTVLTVTGGPTNADGLIWWRVRGTTAEGWMAQAGTDGKALLAREAAVAEPAGTFQIGDTIAALDAVRLRQSAGYVGKLGDDVVATLATGTRLTVVAGPRTVDSLPWWQVDITSLPIGPVRGWVAELAPGGGVLLSKVTGGTTPAPSSDAFATGELVVAVDGVRVRRSPGTSNKPADDVMGEFAARTTLNILEGPRSADGLSWWRVGGVATSGNPVVGWVAQRTAAAVLVARTTPLSGTNIPNRAAGQYLGSPFQGRFGIAQLWGENPQIYSRFTYDGVALRGHNGIDFLTPVGTNLLAVEQGVVAEAVLNDPSGFGNYIKLRHSWGESLYAHMDNLGVQIGQSVARGAFLGRSGNTGFSSGPHLHLALRIDPFRRADGWGGYSDPLPYLNPNDYFLPSALQGVVQRAAEGSASGAFTDVALMKEPGYAPDKPGVIRP